MTTRVIVLPNGRKCSVGTYARAWKALRAAEAKGSKALFPGFFDFPEPAGFIVDAMRGGLSERINRHDPAYGRGRKWDSDYQAALYRDSRRVADIANRIRVYQLETVEARSRFGGRLASREDA